MNDIEERVIDEVRSQVRETLDRIRRIETRFTKYLQTQNFVMYTAKPVWKEGDIIEIPSMDCSIKDILDAVPLEHDPSVDIEVIHKGTLVCWLGKENP